MGKTIPHDDNDDIPVHELELVNIDLELKKSSNEIDLIAV